MAAANKKKHSRNSSRCFFVFLGFNLMGNNFISATSLTRHRLRMREESSLINSMKLLHKALKNGPNYSSASCWLLCSKKSLKHIKIQLKNSWIAKQPFQCLRRPTKNVNEFQVGNCVSVWVKMCKFTVGRSQWANKNSWQISMNVPSNPCAYFIGSGCRFSLECFLIYFICHCS